MQELLQRTWTEIEDRLWQWFNPYELRLKAVAAVPYWVSSIIFIVLSLFAVRKIGLASGQEYASVVIAFSSLVFFFGFVWSMFLIIYGALNRWASLCAFIAGTAGTTAILSHLVTQGAFGREGVKKLEMAVSAEPMAAVIGVVLLLLISMRIGTGFERWVLRSMKLSSWARRRELSVRMSAALLFLNDEKGICLVHDDDSAVLINADINRIGEISGAMRAGETMIRLGFSGLQLRRRWRPCRGYQEEIDIDGLKVVVSTGGDSIGEYEAAGLILKNPDMFWRLAWRLWRSAGSDEAVSITDVQE
ncbi:MAG: hypothetical protein ACR2QC_02175 [Gammaproteobacteria bacterium]